MIIENIYKVFVISNTNRSSFEIITDTGTEIISLCIYCSFIRPISGPLFSIRTFEYLEHSIVEREYSRQYLNIPLLESFVERTSI